MERWQNGDRVVFIGDSLSAAVRYTRILCDFYSVNFPKEDIRFFNTGIPGGSADLAIYFWKSLFSDYKPTAATVFFGVNDMQRPLYSDHVRVTDALLKKREKCIDNYMENLHKIDTLLYDYPHLFITPTFQEDSEIYEAPYYKDFNIGLHAAYKKVKESFSSVVDVHAAMWEANEKRIIPSLFASDRIHPGYVGQTIIAVEILKAQGFEDPEVPIWDPNITDEEKSAITKLGIRISSAKKNPFSDERAVAERKLLELLYVERNVLYGMSIDPKDTEKADAYLREQLLLPLDEWRRGVYEGYLENRDRIPEFMEKVEIASEKMRKAAR